MINTTDEMTDFLDAVERLREDDTTIRTTAHTSSIISDGWAATER
ncbi:MULTISPECIES: hypothetical protein [Nocardia]|nr:MULTISPECIES: hypothetical protein [Nocardia]